MEELKREAEKLAEERRIAREQAMEWTRDIKMESDEERERKTKKARKPKADTGSGDENAETKKKRRTKTKKAGDQGEGEEGALFSDDEEGDKPAKKVCLVTSISMKS
jgi:RNA polymerase-associated protein CTR9